MTNKRGITLLGITSAREHLPHGAQRTVLVQEVEATARILVVDGEPVKCSITE